MEASPKQKQVLRFGIFEIDLRGSELRRHGLRQKLAPQPFEVLRAMLERPGEVITRDQLRERLWPDDKFVDYDLGLKKCINRIREVLGDSAENPRFIETVPRHGYRFIAPLERVAGFSPIRAGVLERSPLRIVQMRTGRGEDIAIAEPDTTTQANVPAEPGTRWDRKGLSQIVIAGVVLLILAVISTSLLRKYRSAKHPGAMPEPIILPLIGVAGEETMPAFSPDGSRIAFVCHDSGQKQSGIYAGVVGIQSFVRLTQNGDDYSPVWSPDGREVAFLRNEYDKFLIGVVPGLGGAERVIYTGPRAPLSYETGGGGLSFSPDSKYLAFSEWNADTQEASIKLLTLQDRRTHFLTSPPTGSHDRRPAFSPDGDNLAFIRSWGPTSVEELFVISTAGGEPKQLTFDRKLIYGPPTWTSDGHEILFSSTRGGLTAIWRMSVTGRVVQRVSGVGPVARYPSLSSSGRELAYEHVDEQQNLWRLELKDAAHARGPASVLVPSAKAQNLLPQFSLDGRKIAFQSMRSGYSELWICDADGSNLVQVTQLEGYAGSPHWSPDDRFLAFDYRPREHSEIYIVETASGRSHAVTAFPGADNVVPSWSRDGKWIYFASKREGKVYQIWKVAVNNETATLAPVQVTKYGGFAAAESMDGQQLFYSKFFEPGIWAVPRDGGHETAVWRGPGPDYWSNWAITKGGVYFFVPENEELPPAIEFFDFKAKRVSRLANLDKPSFY
ncbi:MAG: PD40 domain-containing protein, partial [Acidobacteriaceae bacterium]|nr:PD40 domain-containing protein [Acidobacteriaceae bacterium]